MSKHTPGPWVTQESWGATEITSNGRIAQCLAPIATTDLQYSEPFASAQRANLALILSAPELLEILKKIVEEYEQTYDADCEGGRWKGAASIPVELMERAKELCK